jgi:hypothetical protein
MWSMSQNDVLQAVVAGRAQFDWIELPNSPGVFVFADAMKIDGVRVPVSAYATDDIAQALGVLPTTSMVEDLIQEAATVRVEPTPQNFQHIQEDAIVRAYNADLDRQIAGRSGLVACVGKSWVLDNVAITHPGRAVNYGMFRHDGPYQNVGASFGKTPFKLWQQPSTAHDPAHWDYSQVLRLCKLAPGVRMPSYGTLQATKLFY